MVILRVVSYRSVVILGVGRYRGSMVLLWVGRYRISGNIGGR